MFKLQSLACVSATMVSVGLLVAPVAGSAPRFAATRVLAIQAGTYSGTINVSAGTTQASGGWSITIASSGDANGTLTVAAKISLPSAAGCTNSVSSLKLDVHGTFSGAVAGANVVGVWQTSGGFSPSTFTTNCGGQPSPTTLPPVPSSSTHATFPLGQLLKGGSTNIAGVGAFTLTKAPSSSGGVGNSPGASSGATKPSGSSKGSSTSSPSIPIGAQPPMIPSPATHLVPATVPTPTDPCHEVKSASGQIDICVPSWLSVDASPGVTMQNPWSSSMNFPALSGGKLPQHYTLYTERDQYAAIAIPGSSSVLSVSPNSSASDDPGYFSGRKITICDRDPEHCTGAAGYQMTQAAADALHAAIGGNIPLAILDVYDGVNDLAHNATGSALKAAEILATDEVYVAPIEGTPSGRRTQGVSVGPTNVEIKAVAAKGTTVYVMSGSSIVLDIASGVVVTLKAGQELAIHDGFLLKPKAALARKAKLPRSVRSFDVSAVTQWWKK